MRYIKGLDAYTDEVKTAVTLGKFDGLHRGHQMLVEEIRAYSKKENIQSVVVAFDMKPLHDMLGVPERKVMTNTERKHFLGSKVDVLLECPFTEKIYGMEAVDFIQKILIDKLHAQYVVVGDDFRFGHGRLGDAFMLKEWEAKGAFKVNVIPKKQYHEREISSTYLKEVLPEGKMELVNKLLGYPYTMVGTVIHGNRIGRTLGIPTMNLKPDENKLLPPYGVYECQVYLEEVWHEGICNIGVKPTVGSENEVSVECHLFDYEGNAYGKEIEVRLYHQERGEQKFDGVDKLKEQMIIDIAKGKKYFEDNR